MYQLPTRQAAAAGDRREGLIPESDVDILTRIGEGSESVVHLATLRTTRAGIPVVLDAVAKVSLCVVFSVGRKRPVTPTSRSLRFHVFNAATGFHVICSLCLCQAHRALLPESRDEFLIEPGSEEEKFFVDSVLREARLQARLKHPYVTKVYVTPPSMSVCV